MNKFIIIFMFVFSAIVNASDVVVLEETIPSIRSGRELINTSFYMNLKTGEGFAKTMVAEEDYYPYPNRWCQNGPYGPYANCFPGQRPPRVIFSKTTKIDGLSLVDGKAIFNGAEGEVICGTMGASRIFKIPTLYLSGNCELFGEVKKDVNSDTSILVVTFKTK